jgi:diguanylate cyclase (GGDEF)-like protein
MMSGRALAVAEAPSVASGGTDAVVVAALPPARRPKRPLSIVILAPRDHGADAFAGVVREAAPGETVINSAEVGRALVQAERARQAGREPGVFVFDSRGLPGVDLAKQMHRVVDAHPNAEIVAVVDRRDVGAVAACLQVVRSPERLSFLTAPLHRPDAVATMRAVAERYRLQQTARREAAHDARVIEGLEIQTRELQARLDIALHAARHDGLTGILNRTGFVDELTARLARGQQKQTVLLVDLDRFKTVNDTLGHNAGDDLVRKITTAMLAVIPAGDILARLGGDEFGIIVEGATAQGIAEFCTLILRICGQSRRISGHEVQISASIGVAHQGSSQSQLELMHHADLALYAAKREGRNRYRIFDTALDKVAKHRLSIENGLMRAMNTGQFKMAYQPIVKSGDGQIQGFEALIRWNSPDHGAISPAEFVPVAEETGLILELGDWITRQAFKDCRRWGGPYVSVNVSARQFMRQNVAQRILQYAEDADLPPRQIQIELTETALIDDVERAARNLMVLREAGVRVALDDFGTGYSSLVYLNQFAIDCIKIDKSFVDNIHRDRQSAVIVASVSKLAASLGMSVVAEGVETEAQRAILIAAGCGALQGFHFGRPMSANAVHDLLNGIKTGRIKMEEIG